MSAFVSWLLCTTNGDETALVAKQPSHVAVTKLFPVEARADCKRRVMIKLLLRLNTICRLWGTRVNVGSRGMYLGIFRFYPEEKGLRCPLDMR
jgi:hypothetical protein